MPSQKIDLKCDMITYDSFSEVFEQLLMSPCKQPDNLTACSVLTELDSRVSFLSFS